MNRQDFKNLANIRLRETRALLKSRNYAGAYYLCGYVVECVLKACIAKQTRRFEFPDKKKAQDAYTHNLADLVKGAELRSQLNAEITANSVFASYWSVVEVWTEASRYEQHSRQEAENMFQAVADPVQGVFK